MRPLIGIFDKKVSVPKGYDYIQRNEKYYLYGPDKKGAAPDTSDEVVAAPVVKKKRKKYKKRRKSSAPVETYVAVKVDKALLFDMKKGLPAKIKKMLSLPKGGRPIVSGSGSITIKQMAIEVVKQWDAINKGQPFGVNEIIVGMYRMYKYMPPKRYNVGTLLPWLCEEKIVHRVERGLYKLGKG